MVFCEYKGLWGRDDVDEDIYYCYSMKCKFGKMDSIKKCSKLLLKYFFGRMCRLLFEGEYYWIFEIGEVCLKCEDGEVLL